MWSGRSVTCLEREEVAAVAVEEAMVVDAVVVVAVVGIIGTTIGE